MTALKGPGDPYGKRDDDGYSLLDLAAIIVVVGAIALLIWQFA